jgi:hypothetical protein
VSSKSASGTKTPAVQKRNITAEIITAILHKNKML